MPIYATLLAILSAALVFGGLWMAAADLADLLDDQPGGDA